MASTGLYDDLSTLLGAESVIAPNSRAAGPYLQDATQSRGITGRADAVVLAATPDQVAATLAFAYDHDVAVTTRGGGSGYAAGAVPDGGILLATERLGGVPHVDLERWTMDVPAGVSTADVRERAAANGLFYPPDPGAMEQSLIGGNIATNAGGPHTFKYGVTGRWVQTLSVVLAPGQLVTLGAPVSKDVSSYDLRSLLVGSEGTLGIICGAQLRLIPAPETALPLLGRYPDTATGTAAIGAILSCGAVPAALEYLDTHASDDGTFLVIAEADGTPAAARETAAMIREAMEPGALAIEAPTDRAAINALWRWREGVSLSVTARRGGKLSEDIVVPVTRLAEAIDAIREIGDRHGLPACSWGHAGDGNLHATFLIDHTDRLEIDRAETAAEDWFELAIELGGSVTGEHGIGAVKRAAVARSLGSEVITLNAQIKAALDPKGLLNPHKKLP
jgi:FAD/FMN-containing dehydrogenase